MAYEMIIKKRFSNKFQKLIRYIENEWGTVTADKIEAGLYRNLEKLQVNPFIGSLQGRQKVRSIIFSKHNRLYYRVKGNKILIVNLFDMRINPKRNPYNKK